MGKLVQPPAAPRAHRQHPARRGRAAYYAMLESCHGSVKSKPNGLRKTRGGSDCADRLAQVAQSQPKPKRLGRRRSDRTVCAPPPPGSVSPGLTDSFDFAPQATFQVGCHSHGHLGFVIGSTERPRVEAGPSNPEWQRSFLAGDFLRSQCQFLISILNRITHSDEGGCSKAKERLQVRIAALIAHNGREWCHRGTQAVGVEALVLDEVGEALMVAS